MEAFSYPVFKLKHDTNEYQALIAYASNEHKELVNRLISQLLKLIKTNKWINQDQEFKLNDNDILIVTNHETSQLDISTHLFDALNKVGKKQFKRITGNGVVYTLKKTSSAYQKFEAKIKSDLETVTSQSVAQNEASIKLGHYFQKPVTPFKTQILAPQQLMIDEQLEFLIGGNAVRRELDGFADLYEPVDYQTYLNAVFDTLINQYETDMALRQNG